MRRYPSHDPSEDGLSCETDPGEPALEARAVESSTAIPLVEDDGPDSDEELPAIEVLPGGAPGPVTPRLPRRPPTAKAIARKRRMSELKVLARDPEILALAAVAGDIRPALRAQCPAERPCPFVGCKHHLYLDVNPTTGSIKFNFPDREVWELSETCALDVAERGGVTLEEVGTIMNLTRERIRQLEMAALEKLRLKDAALDNGAVA